MLKENTKAPAISLTGDDNAVHTLAEHLGVPVVLYFYPKDDTPGCTTEACGFRDNMERVQAKGAVVYGISKDTVDSHVKFKGKHQLNFNLLSDPEMQVHEAFGAVADGRCIRSTFLIDKIGNVAKIWSPVKVAGHVDAVMKALMEIK